MVELALVPLVYAIFELIKNRTKLNLILVIIFTSELFAVIRGFNLKTKLYTEFILILAFAGIFLMIKKWLQR